MKIITDTTEIQTAFSQFKADKDGAYPTGPLIPGAYQQANCEEWEERGTINGEPSKVTYLFDRTEDGIDGDPETYPWDAEHITKIEIAKKDDDFIQPIREALSRLDQDAILCDLPDSEFVTGGAITDACRAAGYDESGRVTVNNLNAWNMTVAKFAEYLTPSRED